MTNIKRILTALITLTIFWNLFAAVFAIENTNADDEGVPLADNAFEYAKAPEGLYPFRYNGTEPYDDIEIDTAGCIYGRLYVYNSTEDALIAVSEQNITVYAADMKGYPAVV